MPTSPLGIHFDINDMAFQEAVFVSESLLPERMTSSRDRSAHFGEFARAVRLKPPTRFGESAHPVRVA